jgi:hypothetical protein
MNRQLHAERIVRGTHRRKAHLLSWNVLPDGAFVLVSAGPALVLGATIVPWTVTGYADPQPRPRHGTASVITPPSAVAVLQAGYRPQIDAGALADEETRVIPCPLTSHAHRPSRSLGADISPAPGGVAPRAGGNAPA